MAGKNLGRWKCAALSPAMPHNPILHGLPLVVLVWSLLAAPAHAQFTEQAKLVGPEHGWSVSLPGDGNTAIIGDPFENNQVGAARVYIRAGVFGASKRNWSPQMR